MYILCKFVLKFGMLAFCNFCFAFWDYSVLWHIIMYANQHFYYLVQCLAHVLKEKMSLMLELFCLFFASLQTSGILDFKANPAVGYGRCY